MSLPASFMFCLMEINPSVCILITRFIIIKEMTIVQPEFFVGGNSTEFVRVWSHLGHILRNDLNDDDDIEKRRLQTVKQINDVLCYFGKLDCVIKLKLLCSYYSSICGSELWDLSCTALSSLCVTWRNGLKNAWKLPRNTHAQILYSLCE
jgi:hypothetical protein